MTSRITQAAHPSNAFVLGNETAAAKRDFTVHTGGDSPQRVFHNVHEKGNVMQRGPDAKGEGDIHGNRRGSNNPHGEI
jgi:hypothetical protein